MKNNPWFFFSIIILGFMTGCTALIFGGIGSLQKQQVTSVSEDSILTLELEGVIFDGKKILKQLREYAGKENVKGILIQVNSPGGVVGPSQEIYQEILNIKKEYKKPVYIFGSGLVASGAFYVASAATKVYSNPGTLMGSIGVIMNFADISELYSWAKIKPFNLTTGKFKDTGSEFREMRDDEKQYLQLLLDEALEQFVNHLVDARDLRKDKVLAIADGRIFTGVKAKDYGFVDEIGTYRDALKAIGKETGLGETPKTFTPQKTPEEFFEMLGEAAGKINPLEKMAQDLKLGLLGKPLFLMPQWQR
ncbi:MAG: signal peptide peptidase SppA [Bdellovibrionales bacterium]